MEALYDRMATSITDDLRPPEMLLATKILECVSCSLRVLKVGELSQALGQDTSEMLDAPRTIVDLCRGFVVIDNDSCVAMIHQTARDYLLNNPDGNRRFNVDRQAAHRQLFLSCMRCLMSTGLRASLSRGQKPEFLAYAASSWSSHLISANLRDMETLNTLKKFLTGNWVLTWIHVLAASGQLRLLIRASKDLSRFATKGKPQDPGSTTEAITAPDLELFESWAVDLLRIVGKFSNLLRRKPDSVYKFIPPFCPRSSSIYRLFGKAEAKNLSVTGLSTEVWDDSIARISVGNGPGIFASYIHAAGSQIAVLAPSGSVFFCDSSDFREGTASPIEHGERVDRMALNGTATLLATYGYHSTKVWDVSTGQCKVSVASVESKTRPLTMLFTSNNTTLLIGSDDRRVRSLALMEPEPSWQVVAELFETELEGHYLNSASHMALSEDGSMAAVAYRSHPLSAWETDGPVHIGHCWRKDEAVAIRELRDLVWNPRAPELLGLNLEGVVFKWAPYDGEIEELPAAATKLSISRDGELFATGDGHGRVKLYTTSTFLLLYQLAAQDTVFGLSFSPDSRRLYDIRGYYANAWEPSVLTRFAEESGKDRDSISETESLSGASETSVVISGAVDSITALAGSPKGRLYCGGTYRGVVSLYDTMRGKLADLHVSKAKFTVEEIIWSGDGQCFCFADLSRQVTIFSVKPNIGGTEQPVVEQLAAISMRKIAKGPILQLLFHPGSAYLLVHSTSQIFTVSLASSSVQHTQELEGDAHLQWIVHPREPTLIVGIGPTTIHVFDWDLTERQKYSFLWPLVLPEVTVGHSKHVDAARQVDRLLVSHNKKHIFLQMSHPRNHWQGNQFFFFETSSISNHSLQPEESRENPAPGEHETETERPEQQSINPVALPEDLSRHIALPLTFFSGDRLVFLSTSFSIYSVQLPWSSDPQPLLRSRPSIARPPTTVGTMATEATPSARRQTATSVPLDGMMKELFALPGDWISRDCLLVCSIWGVERSLLCPRNGEVAVVKCTALA
jgi:WD40 repeat protein